MANSSETITYASPHTKYEDPFKVQKADFKPCLKHAAEIIAENPSIETMSKQFCDNCSQSMLSYIFLIQDALDNLARKIYNGKNENCCLQCLRQESRTKFSNIDNSELTAIISELQKDTPNELFLQSSTDVTILPKDDISGVPIRDNNPPKPARKTSIRRNSRRLSRDQKEYENMNPRASLSNENNVDKQGWKMDFLYDLSPKYYVDSQTLRQEWNDFSKKAIIKVNKECTNEQAVRKSKSEDQELPNNNSTETISVPSESDDQDVFLNGQIKSQNISKGFLAEIHKTSRDNSPLILNTQNNEVEDVSDKNNYFHDETPLPIKSTGICNLSENDIKSQENSLITKGDHFICHYNQISAKKQTSSEAFVTICRNNSEVLGCLVLGCSLQLCRSSKTLCVLVLDEVDTKFRAVLSSVFNVVETVTNWDSSNSTIPTHMRHCLAKFNIWRLFNFSKCVYLNPDTLVIRNCDELFQCDELSAVPDTGWPDCFNTGVFVFVPSPEKFSELVELAKKQGHRSDGEDMLLNSFFDSWTRDISKKLSFIYNLVDNGSYTYAPAFHRFGHNVKIVQFTGSPKPWQVKFCTHTDQIHEVMSAHPNFIRFFHEWISIFRVAVLRLLPQDINSKVVSQNTIAAEDILQFIEQAARNKIPNSIFHSSNEDFKTMDSQINSSEKNKQNKKGICTISSNLQPAVQEVEHTFYNKLFAIAHSTSFLIPSNGIACSEQNGECTLNGTKMLAISNEISKVNSGYDKKNLDLPGSVVGDYQGMKVWEQGQMDYTGCDNSENVIKRLQFLMDQPQYRMSGINADTKIAIDQCI